VTQNGSRLKKRDFKTLSIRFAPEVREIVEQAAKADMRPAATWVEKLVIEHLKAQGLLKDGDQ
jgi:predicted DNA-binding protein